MFKVLRYILEISNEKNVGLSSSMCGSMGSRGGLPQILDRDVP